MRVVSVVSPAATGASAPLILDQYLTPQDVGLAITFGTASLTTKVQWTVGKILKADGTIDSSVIWFDDKNLTSLTSNTAGVPICAAGFHIPVTAVRLNNSAWTSGTATLTVAQMGGIS